MPSLSRCVTDAFLWTTCTKKDPEEPFDRFDKLDNPFPCPGGKNLPPFRASLRRCRGPGIEIAKLSDCQWHGSPSQPSHGLPGATGHGERMLQQSLRAIRGSHHHRVVT